MLILSIPKSYPISCNFPTHPKTLAPIHKTQIPFTSKAPSFTPKPLILRPNFKYLQICHNSIDPKGPVVEEGRGPMGATEGMRNDWSTSILLFGFWAGLMYYVVNLSPNQTPVRDMYFLQKLLFLKGDDGFQMNEVLVAVWNMMGLWPVVYSMLFIPSGRSSSKIPVWPFLVLSMFGGAYALIPYFVLWKPPPPAVSEDETKRWYLKFFESKITPTVVLAAGLALIASAGFANADVWKEFFQYFRESKFIHIMSIDFLLLSAFAPFWVYNDMTSRKWDKGLWLLLVALIPIVGPSLYVLLRPPLSALPTSISSTATKSD